jgi:hypothetical protein
MNEEHTVLGMPIKVSDDVRQPIGAVVVIKALDKDGDMCHWIAKTDDVTQVEAIGMCTVAADEFRATLLDLPRK